MAGNAHVKIDLRIDEVMAQVEAAKLNSLQNIALAIEAQAKVNIVSNNQVDTGFMANSGYSKTRKSSGYGATLPTGEYAGQGGRKRRRNAKGQYMKGYTESKGGRRERALEAALPGGKDALVGFAAIYTIYQERRKSFLFAAAKQVVGKVGGLIKKV